MGEMRNACSTLVGNCRGKRVIERPERKREDNIKIDLTEIECEVVDLIQLDQCKVQLWSMRAGQ
jgi:hypothetical protein